MEHDFLFCPNCGSFTFFVRIAGEAPSTVMVTISGRVVLKDGAPYQGVEPERLHCTGCGWNGKKEELEGWA